MKLLPASPTCVCVCACARLLSLLLTAARACLIDRPDANWRWCVLP
jgi:hypothetical protein